MRCRRLDNGVEECVRPGEKALLKMDVQVFEQQVLDGAEFLLPMIAGIHS